MNYKAYDTEDFLLDASFRQYCSGTSAEAVQFWESWLQEHPGKRPQVEEARKIYSLLNGGVDAEVFHVHRQVFLEKLQAAGVELKTPGRPETRAFAPKKHLFYWLTAASVIGVIIVTFLLNKGGKDSFTGSGHLYSSLPGEKKSFQLPDGTKVTLNGGSSLRLEDGFNGASRELKLDGEAFFDVVHNPEAPFIVHCKRFDVKVLGTAFNVRSYDADKRSVAALIRGKIELTFPESVSARDEKLILRPNQQIVVEDGAVVATGSPRATTPAPVKNKQPSPIVVTPLQLMPYDSSVIETSWTENRLVFYNESFEEVAKKLERWFGVTVTFSESSLKAYRYTGTFDKENLPSIIEALKLSKPFHYKFADEQRLLVIEK